MNDYRYRGRFAPSPTGPLHFGSLVAAVGSFLEARHRHGEWLVRMEDLDRPREVAGAADTILHTLDGFGLHWDGEVIYQSRRDSAYRQAFAALEAAGAVYPCACSRREIADSALPGADGPVYPGTCRAGLAAGRPVRAWRVRVEDALIDFVDGVQGRMQSPLDDDVGDFVALRADGLFAYQLAVVVDDAAQGITEVIRGADLLASTARQIYLQRLLGVATPAYAHLPVAVNVRGEKLSKQTGAIALDVADRATLLWQALDFLGQHPPSELRHESLEAVHVWARQHWRRESIPSVAALAYLA
ncbi:MAG: tRNA glutamyl-Q(34) synthetase GluQRS [Gammaproteobacteria bacterium]|nr:tRNA glutamyl-Q(34) synthetase GluQRS [Gammaproteobacteria bacterium]